MGISVKEKELTAVGVSVTSGFKRGTDYHVRAAREAGADDDEIAQAMADALVVRRAATAILARSHTGAPREGRP